MPQNAYSAGVKLGFRRRGSYEPPDGSASTIVMAPHPAERAMREEIVDRAGQVR